MIYLHQKLSVCVCTCISGVSCVYVHVYVVCICVGVYVHMCVDVRGVCMRVLFWGKENNIKFNIDYGHLYHFSP